MRRHEQDKLRRLERLLARLPDQRRRSIASGLEGTIELLLRAEPDLLDLCLRRGAYSSTRCMMHLAYPPAAPAAARGRARPRAR